MPVFPCPSTLFTFVLINLCTFTFAQQALPATAHALIFSATADFRHDSIPTAIQATGAWLAYSDQLSTMICSLIISYAQCFSSPFKIKELKIWKLSMKCWIRSTETTAGLVYLDSQTSVIPAPAFPLITYINRYRGPNENNSAACFKE